MAAVDKLLGAAVQSVKTSGLLESMARMGVVSAVNSDGTVDVSRSGDAFPSVRLLNEAEPPVVGDTVQMLKTMGGWVCVGKLATSSAPRIQSGTVDQAGNSGAWTANMTVTFPKPFAKVPVVVAMPNSGGSAGSSGVMSWQCTSVTTTSFQFRHWRDNTGTATFGWIATTY
jgi:hypothetical protein